MLFKARNLHEALAVSGDMGWRVVGASSGPNSVDSNKLGSTEPTILVMVHPLCDSIINSPHTYSLLFQ